jgi:Tfp pilus assembly protein FimV
MFDSSLDIEHLFGHRRHMVSARIRRRRGAVVVLATALTLALPAASRAIAGGDQPVSTTYVVQAGDTIWSIARRQAPGRDPRTIVDAIVRTNGVDPGRLVPGQTLLLPS